MSRAFSHSTAEMLVQVVQAVHINRTADQTFVEKFCAFSASQAKNALALAVDLQLLKVNGADYEPASPLVRLLNTSDDESKAAVLRIMLESYDPFVRFRERLAITGSADTSAQQTKTLLDLDAHREEIKDTLISLGTYTKAISTQGGGNYTTKDNAVAHQLLVMAKGCANLAAAEVLIRDELGSAADHVDRAEVVSPLAAALLKAGAADSVAAVTEAAKAVESYIARLAGRLTVNLTGATGMGSKIEKFRTGNRLPKKILEASKYLSNVRNAADHGVDVDPDVGVVWKIPPRTALIYVFVACSFIKACDNREHNLDHII